MPVVVETLPPPVQKPKRKRAPPRLRPPPPTPVVAPPPQAPPMVRYATRLNIFSGHQMPLWLIRARPPCLPPVPRQAWPGQDNQHDTSLKSYMDAGAFRPEGVFVISPTRPLSDMCSRTWESVTALHFPNLKPRSMQSLSA